MNTFLFTSESVTEGHPDKMADQISDSILDAILKKDNSAKCAIETLLKTGVCIISGEITTNANINIPKAARKVIKDIGYNSSEQGFDAFTCGILISLDKQSNDIFNGFYKKGYTQQGAGDQGIVFGYACNETKQFMPMSIYYAHILSQRLSYVRKNKLIPWLRPDGKTQVSILYENGVPVSVSNVIISTQHMPNVSFSNITEGIMEEVV